MLVAASKNSSKQVVNYIKKSHAELHVVFKGRKINEIKKTHFVLGCVINFLFTTISLELFSISALSPLQNLLPFNENTLEIFEFFLIMRLSC